MPHRTEQRKVNMKCSVQVLVSCGITLCLLLTVQGFELKDVFAAIQRRSDTQLQDHVDAVAGLILNKTDSNQDDRLAFSEIRAFVTLYFTAYNSASSDEATGYVMSLVTFLDENQDGFLDRNELHRAITVLVKLADRVQLDHVDGKINDERRLSDQMDAVAGLILDKTDSNQDDRLAFSEIRAFVTSYYTAIGDRSADEATGYLMTLVSFMDENLDEFLDRNELRRAISVFIEQAGRVQLATLIQLGNYLDRRINGARRLSDADMVDVLFETMDSDKNGLISGVEMNLLRDKIRLSRQGGTETYQAMLQADLNGDGSLDKSEARQLDESCDNHNFCEIYYTARTLKLYQQIRNLVGEEIANLWTEKLP